MQWIKHFTPFKCHTGLSVWKLLIDCFICVHRQGKLISSRVCVRVECTWEGTELPWSHQWEARDDHIRAKPSWEMFLSSDQRCEGKFSKAYFTQHEQTWVTLWERQHQIHHDKFTSRAFGVDYLGNGRTLLTIASQDEKFIGAWVTVYITDVKILIWQKYKFSAIKHRNQNKNRCYNVVESIQHKWNFVEDW